MKIIDIISLGTRETLLERPFGSLEKTFKDRHHPTTIVAVYDRHHGRIFRYVPSSDESVLKAYIEEKMNER